MSRIKAKKGTLKKVLHYVGRYKPHLAFSIILAAVSVAATLYIPVLAGRAIDNIVDERNVDFAALKPLLIGIGILAAVTALAQ